jgi:hypothetical protein
MLPRGIYISLKSQNIGLKQTSIRMAPHACFAAERQGQHVDFRSCVHSTSVVSQYYHIWQIYLGKVLIPLEGSYKRIPNLVV